MLMYDLIMTITSAVRSILLAAEGGGGGGLVFEVYLNKDVLSLEGRREVVTCQIE